MSSPIIKKQNVRMNMSFVSDIALANRVIEQRNITIQQQAEEIARLKLAIAEKDKYTAWASDTISALRRTAL